MNEKNDERYTGEYGEDGLPRGRGTIDFGDGRRYSGTIDAAAQSGRGVYRYPDGSIFEGGFTVDADSPSWRYVYPDGQVLTGFVSFFPADDKELERGELGETDAICEVITKTAAELGLLVEYNARTILADALRRQGESDLGAAVAEASRGCSGMLTLPYVIRYIYG